MAPLPRYKRETDTRHGIACQKTVCEEGGLAMDRIRNSWSLVKEAWAVLRQDRELALFPVLSGIVSALVLASFALPALLLFPWGELSHTGGSGSFRSEFGAHFGPLHYVGIFLYYLVTYFVVV